MAAYASLLSLMHTINNIKNHPQPPISLHPKHLLSLTQILCFLQDFLERSSSQEDEAEKLESRIRNAAHSAEDVIELHIVDLIKAGSISTVGGENISSDDFYRDLERAIHDLDLIKRDALEIIEVKTMGSQHHNDYQLHTNTSVRPASSWQSNGVVSLDYDLIYKILDKLTGQQSNLQIIPIVGMGGIGKTTLARYIYSNPLIVEQFDILAWVIVSQECSGRQILLQVLGQEYDGSTEDELGLRVYQNFWDRRYLVVMDDMWSNEPWDKIKTFFPDNNNGSRIMITTRQSNLAFLLSGSNDYHMSFLDETKSWDLLCQIVFGKESSCPMELENVGKEIAAGCRGLPLSIVVMAGILAKSNMTRGYWEYTLENLNSIINLEGDEYCLQLLRTSYRELPVYLKPCFLYVGMFPEDEAICVRDLVRLWVVEGIMKPIDGKSLEEVGEVYLKELMDRNLILVEDLRWDGRVKHCRIHDLLRDVCLREAQKQRFYCVVSEVDEIPEGITMERRICINKDIAEEFSPGVVAALKSASRARSLLLMYEIEIDASFSSRVLRVGYFFHRRLVELNSDGCIFQQLNLRYLTLNSGFSGSEECPLQWNLQTLVIDPNPFSFYPLIAPFEIWKMGLLRHAKLGGRRQPSHPQPGIVLEHLQTLSGVVNFVCDEEGVKRIPNIKTLKLEYEGDHELPKEIDLCLDNLGKLEILAISSLVDNLVLKIRFPDSLKKLSLFGSHLDVEELNTKIGSLPLLQVLKLGYDSITGSSWETGEAQFCTLKSLVIDYWHDLEYWSTDGTSFPCLEQLLLRDLTRMEDIPSSIGDVPTLKSIALERCSQSVQESAQRIKEEQEDYGNEDLQIIIT